VRASELDLLTFIAGRCLWSAFVVSGSSFGGGCRVSLFCFPSVGNVVWCFAWASFMCGLQPAFYQLVVDVDALLLPGLWFVVLFLGFRVFSFTSAWLRRRVYFLCRPVRVMLFLGLRCDGSLL